MYVGCTALRRVLHMPRASAGTLSGSRQTWTSYRDGGGEGYLHTRVGLSGYCARSQRGERCSASYGRNRAKWAVFQELWGRDAMLRSWGKSCRRQGIRTASPNGLVSEACAQPSTRRYAKHELWRPFVADQWGALGGKTSRRHVCAGGCAVLALPEANTLRRRTCWRQRTRLHAGCAVAPSGVAALRRQATASQLW